MVIDFHSHNFPEALAARAIESMSARLVDFCSAAGTQYRPAGDGTVATQLRHMDAAQKQTYGELLITLAAERTLPRSVVATSFAVEKRNLKKQKLKERGVIT